MEIVNLEKVRTRSEQKLNFVCGLHAFSAEQKLIHSSIFILDYLLVWCSHLKVKILSETKKKSGINIQQNYGLPEKLNWT